MSVRHHLELAKRKTVVAVVKLRQCFSPSGQEILFSYLDMPCRSMYGGLRLQFPANRVCADGMKKYRNRL